MIYWVPWIIHFTKYNGSLRFNNEIWNQAFWNNPWSLVSWNVFCMFKAVTVRTLSETCIRRLEAAVAMWIWICLVETHGWQSSQDTRTLSWVLTLKIFWFQLYLAWSYTACAGRKFSSGVRLTGFKSQPTNWDNQQGNLVKFLQFSKHSYSNGHSTGLCHVGRLLWGLRET